MCTEGLLHIAGELMSGDAMSLVPARVAQALEYNKSDVTFLRSREVVFSSLSFRGSAPPKVCRGPLLAIGTLSRPCLVYTCQTQVSRLEPEAGGGL